MDLGFEKNFLWGASTSAHQTEGGNVNDWTRWEKKNAEKLAEDARDEFSDLEVWDKIEERATNPENYVSGEAVDGFNRYQEDIEIADQLNMNCLRFSIEWSRIQPEEDRFDEKAIQHYRRIIEELEKRDIEPVVTLWHFTNPQWFADEGCWASEDAVDHFLEYVEKIVEEFGDRISYWITLNEPTGWIIHSNILDKFPPGRKNPVKAFKAYRNMIRAHRKAYAIIHQKQDSKVGAAFNTSFFEPRNQRPLNRFLAALLRKVERGHFINKTSKHLDFIGVNYYQHRQVDWLLRSEKKEKSDIGWDLSPEGFYGVLKQMGKYGKPLIVTEHGLADRQDKYREDYIIESLKKMSEAADEGVDVQGYLHWSLTDNFEWDKGRWPRFGLVKIDYNDLSRNIRSSAERYAEIISKN